MFGSLENVCMFVAIYAVLQAVRAVRKRVEQIELIVTDLRTVRDRVLNE